MRQAILCRILLGIAKLRKEKMKDLYPVYSSIMSNGKVFGKKYFERNVVRTSFSVNVFNTLDGTNAIANTGDVIYTGSEGEQWPDSWDSFRKKYLIHGKPISESDIGYGKIVTVEANTNGPQVMAVESTEEVEFPAPRSWGPDAGVIHVKKGDFIVSVIEDGTPCIENMYCVEGKMFASTYESQKLRR